jgi:hypothetical protein
VHRAALVAALATLAFAPKMCAPKADKPVEAAPAVPTPVAVPITSATTPPIWSPPEVATEPVPAPAQPTASPELVKARAAAEAKDFKKVRSLLEKKARSTRCVPEEAQLVFRACVQLKDKACAEAVKAKHPDDITE